MLYQHSSVFWGNGAAFPPCFSCSKGTGPAQVLEIAASGFFHPAALAMLDL
jgi:hypothetical protein